MNRHAPYEARDFKSLVSTNSTTPAHKGKASFGQCLILFEQEFKGKSLHTQEPFYQTCLHHFYIVKS